MRVIAESRTRSVTYTASDLIYQQSGATGYETLLGGKGAMAIGHFAVSFFFYYRWVGGGYIKSTAEGMQIDTQSVKGLTLSIFHRLTTLRA